MWTLAGLILGQGWFLWLSPLADAWDVPFHLYFSQEFALTLAEEGTRPDWDAAIYEGRGTAAFRFYAPGAYLVASGFQYLGWSAATALRATVIVFLLAGTWGLVRWMACLGLADRAPLAVVLFLANPVVSIHLFRVFLFQNICAMALFPWVLEALTRLGREGDQAALAQGALVGSLIAWTHLPAALMMGYLAAGWVLLAWLWGKTGRLAWRNVLLMPLLAAALTAPYLLEALPELDSLHFSSHLEKQQPWAHQSFLDDPLGPAALPPQLDTPPPSFLGLERPNFRLAMRVAVALAVGLALLALASGRLGCDHPVLLAMICGMVGLGLSSRISLPLWHWMPGWASLQYPWRWVWPGTILLIPAMTGWWVPATGAGSGQLNRLITLTGWSSFAMWVFTALWVQGTAIPLSTDLMERFLVGDFHYPCEYVPATCHLADCRLPRPISARAGPYHQLQVLASGEARLELRHNSRHEAIFHADLPASGGILIGWTHYDQGWALEHAETGQRISLSPYGPCGQLRAELPGGGGTFRLFRVHSPRRTVGMVLALLAVGIVIRLYWKAGSDILPSPSPSYPSA
ncbi:MAG: hypothetical protein OZSIB_3458 [Candidatus Ozemobacter sibiricus]|jgi:hypothetical protein|uniref:Membrane protein 6-pyruvoyl-tetrahydropterin synthase-related domain-containing protein n=1 Tax=Candidatus Ozemobacter sibiricus TaxID=2268124 RepID=A0A367ZQE8_9BACT|nr:MAG: hypothetical protein OZSIB_3458 [Candidatus Ozemobacter sibiricus]